MLNHYFSVVDPWHFGTDPDPDPRIRTTELRIQLRIRIMFFSSVTFKMSKAKNIFFFQVLLLFAFIKGTFSKTKIHFVADRHLPIQSVKGRGDRGPCSYIFQFSFYTAVRILLLAYSPTLSIPLSSFTWTKSWAVPLLSRMCGPMNSKPMTQSSSPPQNPCTIVSAGYEKRFSTGSLFFTEHLFFHSPCRVVLIPLSFSTSRTKNSYRNSSKV
jgi:hypothetical protein